MILLARNQQIVYPESATFKFCYYTLALHGIIHDDALLRGYTYIIEIVIEYKFEYYKIIGENIEIIVD